MTILSVDQQNPMNNFGLMLIFAALFIKEQNSILESLLDEKENNNSQKAEEGATTPGDDLSEIGPEEDEAWEDDSILGEMIDGLTDLSDEETPAEGVNNSNSTISVERPVAHQQVADPIIMNVADIPTDELRNLLNDPTAEIDPITLAMLEAELANRSGFTDTPDESFASEQMNNTSNTTAGGWLNSTPASANSIAALMAMLQQQIAAGAGAHHSFDDFSGDDSNLTEGEGWE